MDTTVTDLTITNNVSTPQLTGFDYNKKIAMLTPDEKKEYAIISQSLDCHNNGSLQQYGSEVSTIIARNGSVLLDTVKSSNNIEIVKYINDLVVELDGFDADIVNYADSDKSVFKKFLYSLPGFKKLKKTLNSVLTQYVSVAENVDKIAQKISSAKMVALRDNNTIQQIFENNQQYIQEIRKYIIAAKLKDEEMDQEIMKMNAEGADPIELQQVTNYHNRLKKRITDMQTTEYVFYQNLFQLAALQENNNAIAEKADNIITHVIPLWKNQLPTAIILKNQKTNIEATNLISETTNKMLQKTAKDLKMCSIDIAKASEESIIDIKTLQSTTQDLIDTVNEVKAIHNNANKERLKVEETLNRLSQNIEDTVIGLDRRLENNEVI